MSLTIRFAQAPDVSLIHSFICELAEYEKLRHEMVATEEGLLKTLFGKKPFAEVLIAEWEREPAGFALFFHNFSTFRGKPGIYLEDLFVRPKFRKKGIGRSLLIELAKLAKERDCARVEWWVLDWNKPSIEFYKKLGATAMGDWTVFRLTDEPLEKLAET